MEGFIVSKEKKADSYWTAFSPPLSYERGGEKSLHSELRGINYLKTGAAAWAQDGALT